ncbi:DNA mismatch repair endonuclease MutL [Yeosuana sp. MJ-SS3]|uniref:DNA mismatch repair protein MutL n=1 Tax=Gilvirhabdus luticola TaxID=3079858 RepID=A0ABU3U8B5_9FLAO|nr:DNA mismatch repair endonuclease MutL [Yeosuana sp. MJ-SS3]MDU8886559.1 DNA mismatch repair endonuclease MutL [Yeosuana sp. MJ-SS3]
MADIIQLLPDHVANQIAAGEVVQRPASVVKELLENAIDAKAAAIKLIVKDAGKTLIQVIDDGIGMSVTDARLSFERHATSKIRTADDLFNLHTKGFRGEALASIAAISHVELKTKPEQDDVGTHLIIEGSKVVSQEVIVTLKGTSISVKNLFYNIPARRNFLKSNSVEMRHIIDEFHRVALTHPDIKFVMFQNGSEHFNLPKSNYRQRIVNIFGSKTNEKLVPIKETTAVVGISGFVCKPMFAKKTRGEQFFFVNNRFIKSAYLNHAVSSAFEGLLKEGMHPSYFLNLEVAPKSIDINIHPTKTEIKFDDEHALYAILRSSVKHSLGQFNIAPVLNFDRDANLDTPYKYKDKKAVAPSVEVDKDFNPFREDKAQQVRTSFKKETTSGWESLYVGLESKSTKTQHDFSEVQFESDEENTQIFEADKTVNVSSKIFQIHRKYVVNTIKSGMLIIDQHKAHQRILYEDFLQYLTVKEAVSQQLLFPLKLYFSAQELEIINQLKEDLEHTGFVFSNFNDSMVEISGIPTNVPESEVSVILEQLISDVQNEVPDANFSATDLLAKSMAKSLAIKTGQELTQMEQEHLVNSLFACKEPNVSPNNKVTFVTMTVDELEKKFM